MDTRISRLSGAVLTLLIGGTATAAPSVPGAGFQGCPMLTNQDLRELRGGFSVPYGATTLDVAFAIQQVTYINGQLKAVTQLSIPSINPQITAPQAPNIQAPSIPSVQLPSIQVPSPGGSPTPQTAPPGSGTGSSPAQTVANTGAGTGSPSASASQPAQTIASSGANPTTTPTTGISGGNPAGTSTVTVNRAVTTIQNGPGNVADLAGLSNLTHHSLTIIQNSLDNQHIQNATVVDATVRNMALYRTLNLSSQISQAVANSVR
ncbi:MAG TPA: hypothetical protein VKA14_05445 [Gammaproteobacteria bacterium]|nr:hypothetical protein [Gammaproteobacteria bacterium]